MKVQSFYFLSEPRTVDKLGTDDRFDGTHEESQSGAQAL